MQILHFVAALTVATGKEVTCKTYHSPRKQLDENTYCQSGFQPLMAKTAIPAP